MHRTKVDRWNLKDNSLSRARNGVDCECTGGGNRKCLEKC